MVRWLAIVVWLFVVPAHADQNDPRLEELFQALLETQDLVAGARVTREIWSIWREIDDGEANTLMAKGILDMARERYAQALTAFDKVVELAPGFAEGWNKRATLFYLMGDFASSADDVKQTLQLEPRHFGALSGLGLLYMEFNNYDAAREAFEDALRVNPHLTGALRNIEIIDQQLRGSAI